MFVPRGRACSGPMAAVSKTGYKGFQVLFLVEVTSIFCFFISLRLIFPPVSTPAMVLAPVPVPPLSQRPDVSPLCLWSLCRPSSTPASGSSGQAWVAHAKVGLLHPVEPTLLSECVGAVLRPFSFHRRAAFSALSPRPVQLPSCRQRQTAPLW